MRGHTTKSPERIAEAKRMRDDGMLLGEIAAELGVARSTVQVWLDDPTGARLKARREAYRKPCVECGTPTNASDGPGRAPARRCPMCAGNVRDEERAATIVRMWGDGCGTAEIAIAVDVSRAHLCRFISRLRRAGYDLPYERGKTDREFVEARWAAGLTAAEIAVELGWQPQSGSGLITNGRERGWDLPLRADAQSRLPRTVIERLWKSGASVVEIAAAIGWKPAAVRSNMPTWRKRGWNLPYRIRRQA